MGGGKGETEEQGNEGEKKRVFEGRKEGGRRSWQPQRELSKD